MSAVYIKLTKHSDGGAEIRPGRGRYGEGRRGRGATSIEKYTKILIEIPDPVPQGFLGTLKLLKTKWKKQK